MKTKYFLFPYVIFLLTLAVLLLSYNKMELHLLLAQHRSVFADYFFRIWTEFGANLPYVFIIILLFYRYSKALYLLSAQLAGAVLSLSLKNIFAEPRPSLYFKTYYPDVVLPKIQGMHLWSTNSMPSGHTISAFAFFFGVALITKNKWLQFLSFVAAALVGYSRVYLSQHFAADITVGSLIGVFSAWVCLPLFTKLNFKMGNRSLADVFKRKSKDMAENQN